MFSNPFFNLHSSYYDPADYYGGPYYARSSLDQRRALAQQRALEQKRAQRRAEMLQRARYLPDEDDDISDEGDWVLRDTLQRHWAQERRQQEEKLINERREEQERLEQLDWEQEKRRRESLRQAHIQRQNRPYPPPPPFPPSRSQSPEHSFQSPPETRIAPQRSPSPTVEPVEAQENIEEQNEAATRIQTAFRVHKALVTLKDLAAQFDTLRNTFTLPTVIDFQAPQSIVSVSVQPGLPTDTIHIDTPKLAYNQMNYKLHSYTESLNRLLIKLDGVESWGNDSVRKIRRSIVGRVEQEASRLETYWKQAWAVYVAQNNSE